MSFLAASKPACGELKVRNLPPSVAGLGSVPTTPGKLLVNELAFIFRGLLFRVALLEAWFVSPPTELKACLPPAFLKSSILSLGTWYCTPSGPIMRVVLGGAAVSVLAADVAPFCWTPNFCA